MKKNGKMSFLPKKRRSLIFSCWLVCFALCLTWVSCDDNDKAETPQYNPDVPVTVTNIEPATGGISTPVVIHGDNFGTDKTKVRVLFDGREAVVINVVNGYIYALVPKCSGGETEVRVVVGEQNEGVLEDVKFDYVISSKVTTLAADYASDFGLPLIACGVDNEENVVILSTSKVQLYSIPENKMVDIMSMEGIYPVSGCFSRDYNYYYVLPSSKTAAVIMLNKKDNWKREMIFDSEEVMKDLTSPIALTSDDEENIYIYGTARDGGALLFKVNRETQKITQIGKLNVDVGTHMAYNPADKFIYMSLSTHMIIKFDSQKENLRENEWQVVTGDGTGEGRDGILSEARLGSPKGLEFDRDNNLYVACDFDHDIKKIDLNEGMVTTIAGSPQGMSGYIDGDAASSRFTAPVYAASTEDGIVYVVEFRRANPSIGWDAVQRLRCVAIQ